MVKKIFILLAGFSFNVLLFCMERSGLQEIAKHKAEFQAGIKKLHNLIPEQNWDNTDHDPATIEFLNTGNREMRNRAQAIAKELEMAFNGISANQGQSQAITTKIEKLAGLKKLWELANHDYVSDMAAASFSTIDQAFYGEEARQQALGYKKMAKELEAAFTQRDELIAHLQTQLSGQQVISAQEHKELQDSAARLKTQLLEKINDAALLTLQVQALTSDAVAKQEALQSKEKEIAQLQKPANILSQQDTYTLIQLQESRKRILSLLAIFSASNTTGWEASFIETVKQELEK